MRMRMNRKASCILWSVCALIFTGCEKAIDVAWEYPMSSRSESTPAVTKGMILFGSHDGNLYALNKDGSYAWNYAAYKEIFSKPTVDESNQRIYFGSESAIIHCINFSGQKIWTFPSGERIKSDVLLHDGIVYFSSYDHYLYALNAANGALTWTFPPKKKPDEPQTEDIVAGEFAYSSPVASNDVIFVGNLDGHLYAVNLDGTLKWKFKAEKGVTSTPLVDNGIVYFGSKDGNLYAVSEASGEKKWAFKTGDFINSSPKIYQGILYFGSDDKKFYALDAKTGEKKWDFQGRAAFISYPAFYKNLVFISGTEGDNTVYAIDINTHKVFWQHETDGGIESDPVVEGDMLYVTSADKKMHAFKIKQTEAK